MLRSCLNCGCTKQYSRYYNIKAQNSIVDTIISRHKTNQDEQIQSLQQEIVNTSSISKRVEHLEKKIEYLTDTTP
jgi:hypothetical protein